MLSENKWQPIQEATLGDEVEWSDGGLVRRGHIVMAPNGGEAMEVCETEPDETLHIMILVLDSGGGLVWLEDMIDLFKRTTGT